MISLRLPPGELTVLCLGAHPDDIEIGCGATLLMLAAQRQLRATVMLLTGSPARDAEARAAATAFLPGAWVKVHNAELRDGRLPAQWDAAKDALEGLAQTLTPDLIFAPRIDDAHQDHRLVAELATTVWRDSLVLHYEIPKWDGDLARPTHYVAVPRQTAELKVALLSSCYPSQVHRDWWTDDLFLGLMRVRGMECRSQYAEAFTAAKVAVSLGG